MPGYRPRHPAPANHGSDGEAEECPAVPLAAITAESLDEEVLARAEEQLGQLEQLANPDEERIAEFAEAWDHWPVTYQPKVNRAARLDLRREEGAQEGKTKLAPAHQKVKDATHRSWWQRARSTAVARLTLGLQEARRHCLTSIDDLVAGLDADRTALPAGELGWSDVGPNQGNVKSIIMNLRTLAHTVAPQRQVNERWKHYVGSYPPEWTAEVLADRQRREQLRQQCLSDAQAVIAALGHEGAGVLFIHWPDSRANQRKPTARKHDQVHWHLIVDRVQPDGMVHQVGNAGIALRVIADALDAEAGQKSGYDPPGKHDKATAKGWGEAESGTIAAELRGGGGVVESIPMLDISAAVRIAQTCGPLESRVSGLMVLQKPSYKDLSGIVRHCAFG